MTDQQRPTPPGDLTEAHEPERTPDPCPGCSHGFHGLPCGRITYTPLWPVKCGCAGSWTEAERGDVA